MYRKYNTRVLQCILSSVVQSKYVVREYFMQLLRFLSERETKDFKIQFGIKSLKTGISFFLKYLWWVLLLEHHKVWPEEIERLFVVTDKIKLDICGQISIWWSNWLSTIILMNPVHVFQEGLPFIEVDYLYIPLHILFCMHW